MTEHSESAQERRIVLSKSEQQQHTTLTVFGVHEPRANVQSLIYRYSKQDNFFPFPQSLVTLKMGNNMQSLQTGINRLSNNFKDLSSLISNCYVS